MFLIFLYAIIRDALQLLHLSLLSNSFIFFKHFATVLLHSHVASFHSLQPLVLRLCHISTCFADMYIPSIRRILEIPPLEIFPFSLLTEAFHVTSPLMRSLYQFNYVTIVNSIEEVFEFRRLLSLVESYDPITFCKKFLLVLKILNILRLVRFFTKGEDLLFVPVHGVPCDRASLVIRFTGSLP